LTRGPPWYIGSLALWISLMRFSLMQNFKKKSRNIYLWVANSAWVKEYVRAKYIIMLDFTLANLADADFSRSQKEHMPRTQCSRVVVRST
jgi:hypothetical protein